MVDFPKKGGGVTAGDVWSYADRQITEIKGQPRTDLMGENADFETGSGARKARIDADISSRSSHGSADIWSEAGRTLTGLTGQPRSDIMGEDADIESGSGSRKARIDRLDNVEIQDTPYEDSLVADGTEQEIVLDETGGNPLRSIEGFIDFTAMQAGDTIVIREYLKLESGGSYVKYAEETYSDAQALPACWIDTKPAKYGLRITLEQTAGTNRTFPYLMRKMRVA